MIKIKNSLVICIIISIFFAFEFFQINVFSSLDTELMKKFNCTAKDLGLFSSIYFYGNLISLIPIGIMLDRYSTRFLILLSMFFSLIGICIFSFSDTLFISSIGRLILGMTGGAICFSSALKLCSNWFSINEMPKVTSIIVSIGMIGGILSQAPFSYLIYKIGYIQASYINIYIGVIIYIIMYLFISNYSEKNNNIKKNNSFFFSFKNIIKNNKNWYCGIYISLLNLPIFLLGALYSNIYLVQIHCLSHNESSIVTTMLFIGMLIGSILMGNISSKNYYRIIFMVLGVCLCIFTVFLLIMINKINFLILLFIYFFMGFSSSAQIIAYPIIIENNNINIVGSSGSFCSMLIIIGGAIFQPIFGYIIQINWSGKIIDNIPIYRIEDFNYALYILILNLIISLIMIPLIFDKISLKYAFYK